MIDENRFLCLNNMHVLVPTNDFPSANFLLGIINSRLMNWYYQTLNPEAGEALAEVKRTNVARLPIANIDANNPAQKQQHDRINSAVEKMRLIAAAQRGAKTDAERRAASNALTKLDRDIDQLVYQLYGLTPEEIALVEGAGAIGKDQPGDPAVEESAAPALETD